MEEMGKMRGSNEIERDKYRRRREQGKTRVKMSGKVIRSHIIMIYFKNY